LPWGDVDEAEKKRIRSLCLKKWKREKTLGQLVTCGGVREKSVWTGGERARQKKRKGASGFSDAIQIGRKPRLGQKGGQGWAQQLDSSPRGHKGFGFVDPPTGQNPQERKKNTGRTGGMNGGKIWG